MGGCLSVSLPCDKVVNQATQWLSVKVSYIHNLEENLAALETNVEELKARRDDLLRRVEREENGGLRRLAEVQVWLTRVETIESQVSGLLSVRTSELQRLCLCGFCSKSLKVSYPYGKRVFKMLKEVENLKANGVFELVADKVQTFEVVERPIQPVIVGRETMLETVWNRLMEDGVSIMGLYGMGGVGKTTLLAHINNKFRKAEDASFIVNWIVVSKDLQIKKIQDEIAEQLKLDGEDWNRKDKEQKACDIYNVLKRNKFVLFLDDIWAKVNLTEIGVPFPSKENGCKVVFTTRSQEVCGRMGADVEVVVECLPPHDALELFKKKVGEITLRSHPNIPELARIIAKKCHGLPLALSVIGETMASKRMIQEWQHAIDVLTSYAVEFSGMEDEILPILKFSYDNLKEHVKSCFLYCALFPEDYIIYKGDLISYWICEVFKDESKGMERAENKAYDIMGTLIRSSLLIEKSSKFVYMHDVVREMALWIASDFGKQKDNFIVHACVGLNEIPKAHHNWNTVKRMSLMFNKINRISGSLDCPELTALLLQHNKTLESISGAFFLNMPRLVVLDLSGSENLCELPEEVSQLVSLKLLCLKATAIQRLPVGFRELKNLIYLDLEFTEHLTSIVGISALLNLKVVKLWASKASFDLNTVEELQILERLEVVTISIRCDSGLDQFLSSHNLMRCTRVVGIEGLQLDSSKVSLLASIHEVTLDGCTFYEEEMDTTTNIRSNKMVPPNACFLSLTKIYINSSKCLKDLTWLMFAPNLTVLSVEGGDELEDVIPKEKTLVCEESEFVPFQRLEYLVLIDLPELKNIYWRPLPFPCLIEIIIEKCPMLRKLPLNSKSGASGEEGLAIYYTEREWLEGVEWEDEATKARFLPSCILDVDFALHHQDSSSSLSPSDVNV